MTDPIIQGVKADVVELKTGLASEEVKAKGFFARNRLFFLLLAADAIAVAIVAFVYG